MSTKGRRLVLQPIKCRRSWFSPVFSIFSVHSEMVDFGSEQGLSVFASTGIVGLFRGLQKSENAALGRKMPFLDGHYLTSYMARNNNPLNLGGSFTDIEQFLVTVKPFHLVFLHQPVSAVDLDSMIDHPAHGFRAV